jgi:hypothetical protein
MNDTMHPSEHKEPKVKDYFWFDPPKPHILPNGEESRTHTWRGETYSHPTLDYEAWRERDNNWKHYLAVRLPFKTLASARFDLPSFPTERWEHLVDDSGNEIPLKIYVHGGRVAGRWLPDPGIVPPAAAPSELSQAFPPVLLTPQKISGSFDEFVRNYRRLPDPSRPRRSRR